MRSLSRDRRAPLLGLCLAAAIALPARAQDFDGDAIPDSIETQSWYVAAGGSVERRDVWVECDVMQGTLRKGPEMRRRVEEVFERAPVPGGIALHLVLDDTIPFEQQWGDIDTNSGLLEAYDRMLQEYDRSFDALPFTGADAQTMRPWVHYCVFVQSIGGNGSTGVSFGIPADLFLVALGQYQGEVPGWLLRAGQAGTFLHELGHNLGLTHGGARPQPHANYKPNYLSVMNYHFQFAFVHRKNGDPAYFPYWDYSRARSNPLHERRLREELGVVLPEDAVVARTPAGDRLLGLTWCDGTRTAFEFNAPVDFDCDGGIEAGNVRADVTRDGRLTKLGRVQNDWENLIFGTRGLRPGRRPLPLDPRTEMRRTDVESLLEP
ncbi:MAG: hypothetical protein R2991_10850 [Thermoanaerobaculia bacterium]